MTERQTIERINRTVRRNNRARLASVCWDSQQQPAQKSRELRALLRQGREDAWLKVQHDRERIPANSRNQAMPRLCPRW